MRKCDIEAVVCLATIALAACTQAEAITGGPGVTGGDDGKGGTAGGNSSGQGGSILGHFDAGWFNPDARAVAPTPTPDANCGLVTIETTRLPANILLLLDRSNSMVNDIAGPGPCERGTACTTRWMAVTDAINAVVPATQESAHWGLKLFATSRNGCDVSNRADVAPGVGTAAEIERVIAATGPSTGTPTAEVLTWAADYMSQLADPNPKYILLATDGQPYCAGPRKDQPDDENAIAAVTRGAAEKGIPVFVVGIAIDAATTETLNKMAVAGGMPRNDPSDPANQFYPADSPAKLQSALEAISHIVATCSFKLAQPPGDGRFIAVYLDGVLLEEGAADGWAYDSATQSVEIKGATCEDVQLGPAKKIQVVTSCTRIVP